MIDWFSTTPISENRFWSVSVVLLFFMTLYFSVDI